MPKIFEGKIVSLKMQKTAVVEVERTLTHPVYKKVLRRSKKYKADTGDLVLNLGDKVKIIETRPTSKNKFFKIMQPKTERKTKWFSIEPF